jgi:hypothetical protein
LNTRADRPLRTDLFTGWIANNISSIEHIIVTGNHAKRAKFSLLKAGIDHGRIFVWGKKQIRNIKENLVQTLSDQSLVIGIGNIGGDGFNILSELR